MLKKFFALPFLFLALACAGQSLRPIAQMVAQAQNPQPVSFFAKQTGQISQNDYTKAALQAGTLLYWDDAKMQELRAAAGKPVSLTLPWENGASMTFDLVPAKNFSPDFKVRAASQGGPDSEVNTGIHYWGTVKGDAETLVTISVFDNELMGMVSTPTARYTIGAIENDRERTHILYKEGDLKKTNAFNCFTDDDLHRIGEKEVAESRSVGPDNCVRMYVEADYTIFQNKGSVANAAAYVMGVFSQVSALYTNESVNVVLHELLVWNVADPYTGPSAGNYLTQFRNAMNGTFNGDLAHLVGIHGNGGVAYLDVLCNGYYSVGYSSIYSTYSNVPTYSWTVEVITHEVGHNLGSSHTHACVWNGNNTAIDGCGPAAGYSEGCNAALPAAGTIMSYCHLVSGVGINFGLGFGPQPGDRIRSEVYNAPCLNVCGGGGGGCTYGAVNSSNFDSGWGIWTDGGTDCARINNATYANSPNFSIRLRDNTSTSVMSTTNQNWTNYDEITVNFSYISVSFENGEDFWVQKSTNGGSTYTTVGDFNAGTEFVNGVRASGQVIIPGPFTSTSRLRFRADASDDDDQVYIDDVVITGCLQNFNGNPNDRRGDDTGAAALNLPGITDLRTGPNPASDVYRIQFSAEAALEAQLTVTDLAGRTVLQNRLQATEGPNQFNIPVSALSNGLYVVTLHAGDEVFTEKMVLSRQ
jgi:hypothetical protein